MRLIVAILAIATAAIGCQDKARTDAPSAEAPNVAADNTGKNERDRNTAEVTSGDQSESAADRGITQQIRKGIVGKDELSISAKNVKIITADGVVTLRGPVKTPQEKTEIAKVAQAVDGVKRLDNQLEVAAN